MDCRTFWSSSVLNAGVLPSVRENLGVLTSRAGLIARMPFSVSQENIHPDRGHVLLVSA
jgi:hypothetical protein